MAHEQQSEFIEIVRRHLPHYFSGSRVIEMGSLDINGSVRGQFSAATYVGVDLGPGPGVDLVSCGHEVDLPSGSFDCAISAECFEHNPYWLETFLNMLRLTRGGGLVLFTCATTGRREHGTRRSAPESSPFTVGRGWTYYRNLAARDFLERVDLAAWLSDWRFIVSHESYDLYFVGLRLGPERPKLPAAIDADLRTRFTPWRSKRALKRRVKVALMGDFWSSPLSYYLRGRR
jgi:SAM-dependent methyltransferase